MGYVLGGAASTAMSGVKDMVFARLPFFGGGGRR